MNRENIQLTLLAFILNLITISFFSHCTPILFLISFILATGASKYLINRIIKEHLLFKLCSVIFLAAPFIYLNSCEKQFEAILGIFIIHCLNFFLIYKITSCRQTSLIFLLNPFLLFEIFNTGYSLSLIITSTLIITLAFKTKSGFLYLLGVGSSVFLQFWTLPFIVLLIKNRFVPQFLFIGFIACIYLLVGSNHSIYFIDKLDQLGDWKFWIIPIIFTRVIYLFFLGGNIKNQIWEFYRWLLFLIPIVEPNFTLPAIICALLLGNTYRFLLISCIAPGLYFIQLDSLNFTNVLIISSFILSLLITETQIRRFVLRKKGEWINQISIVTPIYNEEENIKALSQNLLQEKHLIKEWIIIDAGSNDKSEETSKKAGAIFATSPQKGRGEQIRYGIEKATCEWVLILHADTRLNSNALSSLQQKVYQNHGSIGGAFKMCYRDYAHLGPLFILNDLKTRLFNVSFGDQSQFLKVDKNKSTIPFTPLSLMEDVELSLSWMGKPTLFIDNSRSSTSSRRWKEMGRLNNSVLIIKLLFIYLYKRQFFEEVDVQKLYRQYYKPSK